MIALGTPSTAKLQAQIGEGLSAIAQSDFPERWEGLVDVSLPHHSLFCTGIKAHYAQELVASLSPDNFVINNGVLATAHSIFRRSAYSSSTDRSFRANNSSWRSQFRSDRLYSEINYVLSRFCQPYYELFSHVDRLLSTPASQPLPPNSSLPQLAQALTLLVELFHDLSSQDLPPFFEDHMGDFMGGSGDGWLRKYLSWERDELKGEACLRG
jgi:exportin-2 (importin alpha re-exporter)